MAKAARFIFIVVAILAIVEYVFVSGMFTGPIMLALVWIAGAFNAVLAAKDKNFNSAVLYVIASVALTMGYLKLM